MVLSLPVLVPPFSQLFGLGCYQCFPVSAWFGAEAMGWGRPDYRGGTSKPDVLRQPAASTPPLLWGTSTKGYNILPYLPAWLFPLIISLASTSNALVIWRHTELPWCIFLDSRVVSCSSAGSEVTQPPKEDTNGAPALRFTFAGSQLTSGSFCHGGHDKTSTKEWGWDQGLLYGETRGLKLWK